MRCRAAACDLSLSKEVEYTSKDLIAVFLGVSSPRWGDSKHKETISQHFVFHFEPSVADKAEELVGVVNLDSTSFLVIEIEGFKPGCVVATKSFHKRNSHN